MSGCIFNLYIDDTLVAENVETKVNEPFAFNNMLIYQNSYDYRHLLEVEIHLLPNL